MAVQSPSWIALLALGLALVTECAAKRGGGGGGDGGTCEGDSCTGFIIAALVVFVGLPCAWNCFKQCRGECDEARDPDPGAGRVPRGETAEGDAIVDTQPGDDGDVIRTALGISASDHAVYKALWDVAVGDASSLPAAEAIVFFGKSGVDEKTPGTLRTCWTLADTTAPHGQLDRGEFCRALKAIALAQAGLEVSEAMLKTPTALPHLPLFPVGPHIIHPHSLPSPAPALPPQHLSHLHNARGAARRSSWRPMCVWRGAALVGTPRNTREMS